MPSVSMLNPDQVTPLPCLYTTVRNESGSERVFGFLGPHGKRLKIAQQYTERGNLLDRIAKNSRKWKALEAALDRGDLVIVSTPQSLYYDATTHQTKALQVVNGVVGITAPCWGTYTSLAGDGFATEFEA